MQEGNIEQGYATSDYPKLNRGGAFSDRKSAVSIRFGKEAVWGIRQMQQMFSAQSNIIDAKKRFFLARAI